jgi:hypothetical protein
VIIQNVKDKRVDKLLRREGINNFTVFYSPISFWFFTLIIIVISCISVFYTFFFSEYIIVIVPYLIVSYLIAAYLNNSFSLASEKLVVINPNFPFRSFKSYDRQEIKKIIIDKIRFPWFKIFSVFGKNHITIETKNGNRFKYYCVNLEEDTYDENWTNETIDSFNSLLQSKGYVTVFNIDK